MTAHTTPEGPRRSRTPLGWIRELLDDDRGDVPGWVLVTLMTAGLSVIRRCV